MVLKSVNLPLFSKSSQRLGDSSLPSLNKKNNAVNESLTLFFLRVYPCVKMTINRGEKNGSVSLKLYELHIPWCIRRTRGKEGPISNGLRGRAHIKERGRVAASPFPDFPRPGRVAGAI